MAFVVLLEYVLFLLGRLGPFLRLELFGSLGSLFGLEGFGSFLALGS